MRPTNPPKSSRILTLPPWKLDNPDVARQPAPLWLEPKGVDRFHESARLGRDHATKIRNLMFEDSVLVSRRGTNIMGAAAPSIIMQVADFVRQGTKKITIRFCTRHIEVFEYGTATWRSFPIPLTGGENDFFAWTGWADKVLFSNGIDGLWEFDLRTFIVKIVPGAPSAKQLTTFGGRVVASAVTTGGGEFLPLRVQWSVKNDYTKWDPINDVGAGYEDFYGSPGGVTDEVMGVFPFSDETAWLVRSRSVAQFSVSGNVQSPFRSSQVIAEMGSPFRNSIVNTPSGLVFVSRDNVHLLTTTQHELIGNEIFDEIVEETNTLRAIYGSYDVGRQEYRLAADDLVFRYRFVEKGWTVDVYPIAIKALSRQIQGKSGRPIDSLEGIIDDLIGTIDELVYLREEDDSMMFVPRASELVVREFDGTTDALVTGETTNSEILIVSGVINFEPLSAIELLGLHFEYLSDMDQVMLFEMSEDDGSSFQPLSFKEITTTSGSEIAFVKTERVSRRLQLRLRSSTLGKLRILGVAPEVVRVSRSMASRKLKVASIEVLPSPLSMQVGGTQQLSVIMRAANGSIITGRSVTMVSTNRNVATVSGTGMVRAIAPGTFAISVSVGNTQVSVNGTVDAVTPIAVTSITLTPDVSSGATGTSQQFTATLRDINNNILLGRTVVWGTSDETKATVVAGLVTLIAVGTLAISATSEGVTGSATLVVTASAAVVDTVEVTPSVFSGIVGSTQQLTALPRDIDDNILVGKTIAWLSGAPSVATVSATGLVTFVSAGTVTITATCETIVGSSTGTIAAATIPVWTVTVTPAAFSKLPGQTQQLTVVTRDSNGNVLTGRTITYSTSNSSIALVSTTGLVTALAQGTVTITVTSEGKTASSVGTVGAIAVASVTVSPGTFSTPIGSTVQLTAVARDQANIILTGRLFTWGSSNPVRATVSQTGLVTAISAGAVTITATSEGIQGTSAGLVPVDVDPGLYSPLNAPSTVTYIARPHPFAMTQAPTLPTTFSSVLVNRTFARDNTIANTGNAVTNMANLNAEIALCKATNGHTRITLVNGAVYQGEMELLKHDFAGMWTYITAQTLPCPEGQRATPTTMATAPILRNIGNATNSVRCRRGADNYRVMGLKCDPQPTAVGVVYFTLHINASEPGMTDEQSQALEVHCPRDIVLDRVLVGGPSGSTGLDGNGLPAGRNRNGVCLNGVRVALVDSWITGTYNSGDETHGVIAFNTPGPLKIVNNFIDAGSVPLFFGGTGSALGATLGRPKDLEMRRNHLSHPEAWCQGPGAGGLRFGLKGLFELKNSERSLFEGNYLERCPDAAQTGMGIVIKSAGDGFGTSAGMGTSQATLRWNLEQNIRHAIVIDGFGDPIESAVIQCNHVAVYQNLFYDIGVVLANGSPSGNSDSNAGKEIIMGGATDYLHFRFNTMVVNILGQATFMNIANVTPGTESEYFEHSDNVIMSSGSSAPVFNSGGPFGDAALAVYAQVKAWHRNFITGVDAAYLGNLPTGTGNIYPAASSLNPTIAELLNQLKFLDAPSKNYRLASNSPGKGTALGGLDMGADIDAVDLATLGVRSV